MTEIRKIAVVGGGAAGMMAAVFAARQGAEVTLIEHMDACGRKLRITGKGRCNLTNDCTLEEFLPFELQAAIIAASSIVLSGGISPSQVTITWLPVISLTWSQRSVFSASLQVRRSFCLLFLPTLIS